MRYWIIAMLSLCLCGSAQAHGHKHHGNAHHHRQHIDKPVAHIAQGMTFADQWVSLAAVPFAIAEAFVEAPARYSRHVARFGAEIISHPAGCPRIAFCGCGVADRVFGRPVRDLWLAANWLRFPRTSAAPGMVAVFGRHHVAYIEQVYGDGTATLYDPNSGGHLTRRHRMSIVRATIVDPRRA